MELEEAPVIPVPSQSRESVPDDPFAPMALLQKHLGKVVVMDVQAADGAVRSVWVNDRDVARSMLEDTDGVWLKGPQTAEPFSSIVELHMIAVEGEQHRRLRRAGQAALNDQVRERAVEISLRHARRLAQALANEAGPEGQLVVEDLDRRLRSAALDIISEMVFGEPWGAVDDYSESNAKAHALSQLMHVLHWRVTDVSERAWRSLPSGEGEAARWRSILLPFIRDQVASRRAMPEAQACADATMLGAWMRHEAALSDVELENLCLTFLTMGHENISTAIAWTLLLLAQDREAQAHVRAEVVASGLLDTSAQDVSWAQLNGLKAAEQAFVEASRLYPSVAVVTRVARIDTTLCGYRVPAGTEVVLSLYALNRDEEVWGKDASRFVCPHRAHSDNDYWSFGGGDRKCVGRPLSNVEQKALVAALLGAFELECEMEGPVLARSFVSYRPGAHRVRLKAVARSASRL